MIARPWIAAALAASAACSPGEQKRVGDADKPAAAPASSTSGVDLVGAGATFPYPLYSKWFSQYAAKTGVKINYQPIGSGGGIRQLSEQTVDFGASDAPMSDDELAKAKGGAILHIPTVIGAVAITYNLPAIPKPVQLTPAVVADIFLGKITKWNDARIVALNGDAKLPGSDILVVHRSDGSGTTYVVTDYLTTVSPAWKSGPGKGKEVQWPVGLGAKGNEGVAGQIKQTPGALGYVELAYAKQNNMPVAALQNAAGKFVPPSLEGASAAAAGTISKLPEDTDYRLSIVNSPGADAYPIASLTWLLIYQKSSHPAKAKKLVDFIRWALTEGEQQAASLDYAPLPGAVTARLTKRLSTVEGGS
ncbi:MAG: phosphate ABC transporter substrate-binding protein PstS [Gemmatimonadaceae bacterium]